MTIIARLAAMPMDVYTVLRVGFLSWNRFPIPWNFFAFLSRSVVDSSSIPSMSQQAAVATIAAAAAAAAAAGL